MLHKRSIQELGRIAQFTGMSNEQNFDTLQLIMMCVVLLSRMILNTFVLNTFVVIKANLKVEYLTLIFLLGAKWSSNVWQFFWGLRIGESFGSVICHPVHIKGETIVISHYKIRDYVRSNPALAFDTFSMQRKHDICRFAFGNLFCLNLVYEK